MWDLLVGSDWNMAGCRVTMVGHFDTVRCLQVRHFHFLTAHELDHMIFVYSKRPFQIDRCTWLCSLHMQFFIDLYNVIFVFLVTWIFDNLIKNDMVVIQNYKNERADVLVMWKITISAQLVRQKMELCTPCKTYVS